MRKLNKVEQLYMNYGQINISFLLEIQSILSFSRSPSIDNETLLAEIACMLIEAGANVDQIDIDHFTPLIYGKQHRRELFPNDLFLLFSSGLSQSSEFGLSSP